MTIGSGREQMKEAFARLASLVESEGYAANVWIRRLRAIQHILSDADVNDAEAIGEVRHLYWAMYTGGRNFGDFFLWREDEMERILASQELEAARTAIEKLLQE